MEKGICFEKTGIKQIVIEEIIDLAQKYRVKKVVLFGSRARGDFKQRSDIDLAVQGGDYNGFALAVEEETSTLLRYDVVILDGTVQGELREVIGREGVVIYEEI